MMREKDRDPSSRNVPYCPLSEQCVYFMHELEWQEESERPALSTMQDGAFDRELIARLRVHIRDCIACVGAIEDARRVQRAQRSELHDLLRDQEQYIPSTSAQIMHMLEDEGRLPRASSEVGAFSLPHSLSGSASGPERRTWWHTITSLVAVGIFILASSGLFGYLSSLHTTFVSKAAVAAAPVSGWTSAVLTITQMGNVSIHVLDPLSGRSVLLASSHFLKGTSTEGVSHDGTKLLYYIYDGKKTDYYLQPSAKASVLYTFHGKGGHAIWSTGDHDIFVSTAHGVEQVDTQNGSAKLVLPGLKYPDLRFYHGGNLYYVSSHSNGAEVLNRINVGGVRGAAQEVTKCLRSSSFWLSPTGQTIYYICHGQRALFSVNTDGTNVHRVRSDVETMIGYAEDNTPLLLNQAHGKYQIVKPGEDTSQDRVLLDDVVPGASLISAENVVVAPYGHTLVAKAIYPDRHEEIWYGDLSTGEKHLLLTLGKAMQIELGGWSRIRLTDASQFQGLPTQNFSALY